MGDFPADLKNLENKSFTITLLIKDDNIEMKSIRYLATNIFEGFEISEECSSWSVAYNNVDNEVFHITT